MTAAFWAGAVALAVIVVWMLLPSLLGRRARAPVEPVEMAAPVRANLAVLRQQRTQLDADLAAGTLSAEQHRAALDDIERRVLEEEGDAGPAGSASTGPARTTAWVLGAALPVLAIGLYLKLGQPQALQPVAVAPPSAAASGEKQITAEDVMAMIDQLNKRMAEKPDDVQGWLMLARANAALQRYDEASRAFARASQLQPNDAQLLADQADALAMAQGGTALGEPTKLIERALKADPNNMKALALAGTAAFERQDFAAAERHWAKASELAPPDTELAKGLAEGLRDARARLGKTGPAAVPGAGAMADAGGAAAQSGAGSSATAQTPAQASAASAQVSGRVSLAPAAAGRVAPTDTVFIVARAASGPRMPLAVIRKQVSDLPLSFTLDDSMAMAPEMKLSAFPKVVVVARISKTGSATPAPDDLVVQSAPLDVGAKGVELLIEKTGP